MAQIQQPARVRRIQGEPKSVTDVIDRTRRTLALCQLGLKDLLESTDVTRQIAGIATVAVQGRAVTNVIQKIRGFNPPYRHRGEPIADISAQGICLLYVKYLGDFVRDAVAHFSEAAV